jgi:probable phosphoglycerate mutase
MLEASSISLLTQPFYFVRHGESESNLNNTIAGSLDVPLTKRGLSQAQAAAAAVQSIGVTAIYSSALTRARVTADCIAHTLALQVTVIPELAERNWGELEGQPQSSRIRGVTPAGAETAQQFMERVMRGLAQIDAAGAPLIVAHSGVFRALCRILGIPEPAAPVTNAQPVRFMLPRAPNLAWQVESI